MGIELNPGAAALARQNLADNGLAGEILPGDLRDRTLLAGGPVPPGGSNPPYFRAGSGKSGARPGWTTPARSPTSARRRGGWPAPGAVCPGLPP